MIYTILLCGCQYEILNDYRLEKYKGSEVPVCVDYRKRVKIVKESYVEQDVCGNIRYVPSKYKETERLCDILEPQVVSYNYCLAQLPKPVHLVEKKIGNSTLLFLS